MAVIESGGPDRYQCKSQKPRMRCVLKINAPGCTTIGLRLIPPQDTSTLPSDRQLIRFIDDVSPTPSSASAIGAFSVSIATRFDEIGTVYHDDVAAERLQLDDNLITTDHV